MLALPFNFKMRFVTYCNVHVQPQKEAFSVPFIACVSGGIVGARNNVLTAEPLKVNGETARRIDKRLRRQNFIPRAYNTASYAGYTFYCFEPKKNMTGD